VNRRKQFVLAGGAMLLILSIAVVVILILMPPKRMEFTIVIPESDALFAPDRRAALLGAEALAEAVTETKRGTLSAPPRETMGRSKWKEKLNPKAESIALVFAAPGSTDDRGPYVWMVPAGAATLEEEHKLYVDEILDELKRLPAAQPKLLMFETYASHPAFAYGLTNSDFAAGLTQLDQTIATVSGLAVVHSCDIHQRPALLEFAGTTLFLHQLQLHLRYGRGTADSRQTGTEWIDAVSTDVERTAAGMYDWAQKPLVLPKSDGLTRLAAISPNNHGRTPPATVTESSDAMPAALQEEWRMADGLGGLHLEADHPSGYRAYLETLLRAERDSRLGVSTDQLAASVQRAASLRQTLETAARTETPAAKSSGSYAVIRLARGSAASFDDLQLQRLRLPPAGRTVAQEWKSLREARTDEQLFRLATGAAIYRWLLKEQASEAALEEADKLFAEVDPPPQTGPAESHFVRMLRKHLVAGSKRPPTALIVKLLQLKQTAEAVAWHGNADPGEVTYAAACAPWFAADLNAGDEQRRKAEDLLFAADVGSFREAETTATQAERHYQSASARAAIVRAALKQRDRTFTRLPYYARRLADGVPGSLPAERAELLSAADAAFEQSHRISAILSRKIEDATHAAALDQLREATTVIAKSAKLLEDEARAAAAKANSAALPANRNQCEALLTIPFLTAESRAEIYKHVCSAGRKLNLNAEHATATPSAEVTASEAQVRADHLQRLASAILSPVNRTAPRSGLDKPDRANLRAEAEILGKSFRSLSKAAESEQPSRSIVDGRPARASAAARERLIEAGMVRTDRESAVREESRIQHHDFFLRHAERSLDDGWADPASSPSTSDWYCKKVLGNHVAAAKSYLFDGKAELPPERRHHAAGIEAMLLRQPIRLDFRCPTDIALTDESTWTFEYAVQAPRAGRIGFPVIRQTGLVAPYTKTPSDADEREVIRNLAGANAISTQRVHQLAGAQPDRPTDIRTQLFYRGAVEERRTALAQSPGPNLQIVQRTPEGPGKFAVIGDPALIRGAVTLLIDLSGSMLENVPNGAGSKFDAVLESLKPMLRGLAEQTTLTIGFFWGSSASPELLFPENLLQKRWLGGEKRVEDMVKAVKANEPRNAATPLVRAVQDTLLPANAKRCWPDEYTGTRTLIVLTDGIDNDHATVNIGPDGSAGTKLCKLVDQSPEPLALHVVLFALGQGEAAVAKVQYNALNEPFAFEDLQGKTTRAITDIATGEQLAQALTDSLAPRIRYSSTEAKTTNAQRGTELGLTFVDRDQVLIRTPDLQAGRFNLFGLRARTILSLPKGQRVVVKAEAAGILNRLSLPAVSYERCGRTPLRPRYVNEKLPQSDRVYFSFPKYDLADVGATCRLSLIAAMEKPSTTDGMRGLVRRSPAFAWFEIAHPSKPVTEYQTRILNKPQFPAPAWDITAKNWGDHHDTAPGPTIDATWIETWPKNAAILAVPKLMDPQAAVLAGGSTLRLPGRANDARIRGLAIEPFSQAGLPAGNYLTIRYEWPADHPRILVRAIRSERQTVLQPWSEQHDYYDALHRYTVRFGPIAETDLQFGIELHHHSVPDLLATNPNGRSERIPLSQEVPFPKADLPPWLEFP